MPTIKPELRWLTDPTVFAVNRLDAHSDHVAYRTLEGKRSPTAPACAQSLDGEWRFAWSPNPRRPSSGFLAPGGRSLGLRHHPGAGAYRAAGLRAELQYTNTLYPWDGRAPPCARPRSTGTTPRVGSYVTDFTLDEGLRGPAGLHQLSRAYEAGPVPMGCNGVFCGLRRGQLHPLGV